MQNPNLSSADQLTSRPSSYYERNRRWLSPLVFSGIAVFGAELAASMVIEPGQPTPPIILLAVSIALLMVKGASILALIVAGTFARLCDTASARLFSIALPIFGLGAAALLVWNHVGH